MFFLSSLRGLSLSFLPMATLAPHQIIQFCRYLNRASAINRPSISCANNVPASRHKPRAARNDSVQMETTVRCSNFHFLHVNSALRSLQSNWIIRQHQKLDSTHPFILLSKFQSKVYERRHLDIITISLSIYTSRPAIQMY